VVCVDSLLGGALGTLSPFLVLGFRLSCVLGSRLLGSRLGLARVSHRLLAVVNALLASHGRQSGGCSDGEACEAASMGVEGQSVVCAVFLRGSAVGRGPV